MLKNRWLVVLFVITCCTLASVYAAISAEVGQEQPAVHAAEYNALLSPVFTHKYAAETNWLCSSFDRMRSKPRSTSRGSCAHGATDSIATFIIAAISAAGTPCPETSATRKPIRF